MATPIVETASKTVTEFPVLAQKSREQLVSNLEQGHQVSIDAAQVWVEAVSTLPFFDLPMVFGLLPMPDLEATTKYTFDLAADLLNAQREFALQLVSILVPTKKV